MGFEGGAPFFRTDFSDDAAWRQVASEAQAESEEGFIAYVTLVEDRAYEGATPKEVATVAREGGAAVLFVADALTMTDGGHPILCVDPIHPQRSFRVVPSALWAVENNLSIANMDFEEFLDATDGNGVFRGF